jgi:aspartokinase-like uncharacterized kinase
MNAVMEENIVLKIGGASLFGGLHVIEQVRSAVGPSAKQRLFVLFGGGDTIESMRSLHALFPQLDVEAMHWRCVRLLDATWEVGCELFPEAVPVATWDALQRAKNGPLGKSYLVRVAAFYSPELLPQIERDLHPAHDWNTTTDVLSWILAQLVGAAELRITKRRPVDPAMSIRNAARCGMIDSELVRLVTLRDPLERPGIRFLHLKENS